LTAGWERAVICGVVTGKHRNTPWYTQAEQKPPDIRDADEHAAIIKALDQLPSDHAARVAYSKGADTIALTHLVADRPDIVHAITEAYLAGYRRSLARWGGFRA
jgi:hypothetical protein